MVVALTDQQRQIVVETFSRLIPISEHAAAMFYDRLWEIAPETRSLFHATDMPQQGMKLMQTLGIAVRALHDIDSIVPLLHDLGARHIRYGVTVDQFALVKDALLWMIAQTLGEDYTPEVHEAWSDAFDLITSITVSAYE